MSCEHWSRRDFLARACSGSMAAACGALALPEAWAGLPIVDVVGRASREERAYPVPPADGVSIDRSVAIMIVRLEGRAFALGLTCPHQQAAVRWVPARARFQCSKHDSLYTPEGAYISGRATRHLDRFPIRREGATLYVHVDRPIRADQDPKGWAAAAVVL